MVSAPSKLYKCSCVPLGSAPGQRLFHEGGGDVSGTLTLESLSDTISMEAMASPSGHFAYVVDMASKA